MLVVDQRLFAEVERVRERLTHVAPENILVLRTATARRPVDARDLVRAVAREVGAGRRKSLDAPGVDVEARAAA